MQNNLKPKWVESSVVQHSTAPFPIFPSVPEEIRVLRTRVEKSHHTSNAISLILTSYLITPSRNVLKISRLTFLRMSHWGWGKKKNKKRKRKFRWTIVYTIVSLGKHDDDGNKNPTNLHIWQWKTGFLHALHVHFSSFDILKKFSFFLRRQMTCFAVVWTTRAYDDKCSILSSFVPGSNLIPG